MLSVHCEAMRRLEILRLLKENVMDSPFLKAEVEVSAEVLNKQLKVDIRNIASDKISVAMQINDFNENTEAYQAAMGIYMVDETLFTNVFNDVFKEIANDDSFEQIITLLNNFKDCGPLICAYCSLFTHVSSISENLWGFECAVNKLLKKTNLMATEKKELFDARDIERLNELLNGIRRKSEEYLKYQAAVSYFEDFAC